MMPSEEIKIPQDNVNDEEVIITNIYVNNDQEIDKDTHVADYETSKANFELYSKSKGYVFLKCSKGDSVKVGSTIIDIFEKPFSPSIEDEKSNLNDLKQNISKKALEKIKKHNLDISLFDGGILVTEKVVDEYINKTLKNNHVERIINFSQIKQTEIENLFDGARLGLVSSVSKSFNVDTEKINHYHTYKEFKDSVSTLLIDVASKILLQDKYKHLNSFVRDKTVNIYKSVHFGLALNLGNGLKIGVIKDSQSMDINQIESRVIELIDAYIDNKMSLDDVEGATVVLTDLTEQNIDIFSPLILKNNTIMFGLSGSKGKIQTITIAFDHRVSDGLEIANLLNDIILKITVDL